MNGLKNWFFPVLLGIVVTACGLWALMGDMRVPVSQKVVATATPLLAQLNAERAVRLQELRAASVYVYADIPRTRLYLEPTVPDAFRDSTKFGSGVVVTPEGDLFTAAHVVKAVCMSSEQTSTDEVYCAIVNIGHTRVHRAMLVKMDETLDIAHLRIIKKQRGETFAAVPLMDSSHDEKLEGREVLINGLPFGAANMAVAGMVSNATDQDEVCDKGRTRVTISAASGNSGGAVFDIGHGALVGLVLTVKALKTKKSETLFLNVMCAASTKQLRSFMK